MSMTHDDLQTLHNQITPLLVANLRPKQFDPDDSVGMSIPPARFPDLVTVFAKWNLNQGSQNLVNSILACVVQISMVTH